MRQVLDMKACVMVGKNDLKKWIRKYAANYSEFTIRSRFVKLAECTDYEIAGSRHIRVIFVAYDQCRQCMCTVKLHDAIHATSQEIDDGVRRAFDQAKLCSDYDAVARLNATRYHVHRFIYDLTNYVSCNGPVTNYLRPLKRFTVLRQGRMSKIVSRLRERIRHEPVVHNTCSVVPALPIMLTAEEKKDLEAIHSM